MKLNETINKAAKIWETVMNQMNIKEFNDNLKMAFNDHKNVLGELEDEIIEPFSTDEHTTKECSIINDLNNLKTNFDKIDYKIVDNSNKILKGIIENTKTIDLSLERLKLVRLPKEVKYEAKETQTEDIKANVADNTLNLEDESYAESICGLSKVKTMANSLVSLFSDYEEETERESRKPDSFIKNFASIKIDRKSVV